MSISPSDFSNESARKIFSVLELFYRKYSTIPQVSELELVVNQSIKDLPHKKREPLLEFTKLVTHIAETVKNRDLYLDLSREHIAKTRFQKALLSAAEYENDIPHALSLLTEATQMELTAGDVTRFRDLSRLSNADKLIRKMPTGYNCFDELLGGGVLVPSLTVFAGKPFAGKTLMLTNLAKNMVMNGQRVLYFSMELPSSAITMRIDTAILGKKYNDCYKECNLDATKGELKALLGATPGDCITIKYPSGVSVDKLAVHCDIATSLYGPYDAIFVDYIGLLTSSRKVDTMYEKGKIVSEELVTLSEKMDVPVYAASQMTKRAAQVTSIKDLNEGDIAESWGIQQVAYNVALLSKASSSLVTPKILCKWVKNRSGGELGIHSLYEVKDTFLLVEDINEFFNITNKLGNGLSPEVLEALQVDELMEGAASK